MGRLSLGGVGSWGGRRSDFLVGSLHLPQFPAALSFVMVLGPDEARTVLERRADGVRDRLAELEQELAKYHDELPRAALLETEYLGAVAAAELAWLTNVLDDLRSGSLAWSAEDFDPANFDVPETASEP